MSIQDRGIDVESVAAAWRGEDDFTRAVTPHVPALVRLARRRLGSDDLAWEAVQDSLLCLWRAPARPAHVPGWLAVAVIHRTRHLRRTLLRRWRHEEQAPPCHWSAATLPDPERCAELAAVRRLLAAAVGALPPEQSAIVALKDIDGADYESIARSLAVPVGTVRSRLHRARGALRARLGPGHSSRDPRAHHAPDRRACR
jgi:RNA polymerase sigma factor (sigma-70 family)